MNPLHRHIQKYSTLLIVIYDAAFLKPEEYDTGINCLWSCILALFVNMELQWKVAFLIKTLKCKNCITEKTECVGTYSNICYLFFFSSLV